MPFTRAQATDLLNQTEMRLFDDSRANALRGLDRAALAARVARARTARDRARDLLKRQRAAARKDGPAGRDGVAARTARKEELLVEVLDRFVAARRAAPAASARKTTPAAARKAAEPVAKQRAAKKATTASAKKATATAKKAATATARKAATGAATRASTAAAAKKVPAKKASSRKASGTGKRAGSVTPERALENTRRLLEAKQERDRAPQPWHSLDPAADHVPQPGFQSPQAAGKAQDLHAGESRMASIHGSISTHDRHNQGKRDNRGEND